MAKQATPGYHRRTPDRPVGGAGRTVESFKIPDDEWMIV